MLGNIKIEKYKLYRDKIRVHLRDTDIEKVLASNKISLRKITINTLLVTCIMIIKLIH